MKSALSNLSICKVSCKTKKLKIWAQKYLIWVFLDRVLKKTIFIFEGSTLELVKANIIHIKPKKKVWEQITYYLFTFRLKLEKCHT